MKAHQQIIGGRYQYNTVSPISTNQLYTQYKCYDKVTKRDLILHILPRDDSFLQAVRQMKHPFILLIFDIITIDESHVAFLYQNVVAATLIQILENNGYIKQEDALFIIKVLLLAVQQFHKKQVAFGRICPQNICFCLASLIKLGFNKYQQQIPAQCHSPQFLNGKKLSPSSDIFSLGVILYRMIYGVYPFECLSEKDQLKKIKNKDYNQKYNEGHSPFKILISKQVKNLVQSMLQYHEQKRPTIDTIVSLNCMNFSIQTDLQAYIKPKGNLLPEPFIKKYLLYRPTKMLHKYGEYYQQYSYLALNIKQKIMVTIYCPEIRMFQAQPRKVQSYYQKLRALSEKYTQQSAQFLIKLLDIQKFRQQPIFVTEYCNQGDLFNYLQKKREEQGWLKQKTVNIMMYILALGFKQMRQLGVTSIHTVNPNRIMLKDKVMKIRQPGLITPTIQKRLIENKGNIDFFAPQLKENVEMVQLDKSDMWSYGILYYYFLSGNMPIINEQLQSIDIQSLKTDQKNKNIIGKCLDFNVDNRIQLEKIKLQNVDEQLLSLMLKQKHQYEQLLKEAHVKSQENQQINQQERPVDRKAIFKHKKPPMFKDYNKIIANSSTSGCRIYFKAIISILVFFIVFFGRFLINGGYGIIRSNYYKPITMRVAYNYGTSLTNMTILTTDGNNIQKYYSKYSYEQFTLTLRCAPNNYKKDAPGVVDDFINGSNTAFCLFGYIYVIVFLVLYFIFSRKLDLPVVLYDRKQKKQNKYLFHFIVMLTILPSILFCFFYIFAIQYLMQIKPCFGLEDLSYPKFTSIQALLAGDTGQFFLKIFLTVILWATFLFLYGYLTLLTRKFNNILYEWKLILPLFAVMTIFTIICRVGLGSSSVIEPTWTYKINTDLVLNTYYGFFGMFPQALFLIIFVFDRIVDFVFWYFLKRGLEGEHEEDIKHVKIIQAKYQPLDAKKLQNEKSNIYMIDHEFQAFD